MRIDPYIIFNGNCKEAFTHYAKVLDGKIVAMINHSEAPPGTHAGPEWTDMIMHARIEVGDAVLMGSDSPPEWYQKPAGDYVSIRLDTIEQAEKAYAELSPEGEITMPLQETFWAHRFAMFTDKYSTRWMINCEKPMG